MGEIESGRNLRRLVLLYHRLTDVDSLTIAKLYRMPWYIRTHE